MVCSAGGCRIVAGLILGKANIPGLGNTAGIWFGTADSFVPLAPFLPSVYYQSVATCVAEANGVFYVGGYATTTASPSHDEAFLWVGVPAPASMAAFLLAALLFGTLAQGGLALNAHVPMEMMDIVQAVVIVSVALADTKIRAALARSVRVVAALSAPESGPA